MNEDEIQERRRARDEEAAEQRARIIGLPYLDTRSFERTSKLTSGILDVSDMYKNHVVPLRKGDGEHPYEFMVTSQTPRSLIESIRKEYNNNGIDIEFYLISDSAYRVFMMRYDPPKEIIYDDIKISKSDDRGAVEEVSKLLESVATDKVFNFLIDQADKLHASDIHIENLRGAIRVRMRVDGILHPIAELSKDKYRIFIGELSSRANVSLAATTPQSSHIQTDITRGGKTHMLNIRVETVPTLYGQDAVLRLFNFNESDLDLNLLGLGKQELEQVKQVISHPRGMVLLVGPTGSGKSTTLYSILNALNTFERKIITLEDPIEFSINGITQIPIRTGDQAMFTDALHSVLRLDPDVVMVGEIRDQDTAKTAIQASITGHLVLSSFHANSTSAAFSRMIDLIGVNPIFSSSIRMLIAQRLLRRLDDNTKEEYEPDEATKKWVREALKHLPDDKKPNLDKFKLWQAVSTPESPFGYVGRIVIMEQMVVDETIQKFIRGDVTDTNTEAIEKQARKNGMLTLLEHGVLAALRGETTLEEVNRVL
ncbi:MAG: Flp pilus assembly complex ATPase component TadA [Candidatus Nomurabacteria bacterium]|nr:Flp pilus assembly complex ATPase component TadA [Candidatus Nomurabacteria bacterium]